MTHNPRDSSTAGVETFDLFRLQPNVPFKHAFSQLSVLLGCIRHLTTEAEMEDDRVAGSAARILSELAKALIDDMERGMGKNLQLPTTTWGRVAAHRRPSQLLPVRRRC